MNKLVILTKSIILVFILGCTDNNQVSKEDSELEEISASELPISLIKPEDLEIITIDSCEYIIYKHSVSNRGFGFLAHKGNCSNSVHIYNTSTYTPGKVD